MKIFRVLVVLLFLSEITGISQTNYRFQRKISGLLSKDKIEEAEDFCSGLKSEKDRAECYNYMGDKALNENDFDLALEYYVKSTDDNKQHALLLKAIDNNTAYTVENYFVRLGKDTDYELNKQNPEEWASRYLADLCYKLKDYKNAAIYYQKANVHQLSNDCKVLDAIERKDYMTVVELAEKETVGIKNTIELYNMAAEQFVEARNYEKAADCYKKTGNKAKERYCFYKAQEANLIYALKKINSNSINFSEQYSTISSKIVALSDGQKDIDKIVVELRNNKFSKTAYDWQSISEYLNKLLNITRNETYLKFDKADSTNVKTELKSTWDDFRKYTQGSDIKKISLKLHLLETHFEQIEKINKSFQTETEVLADNAETKSFLAKSNSSYFFERAVKNIENEMNRYIKEMDSTENKHIDYQHFCLIRELHKRINDRADKLISSVKSENLQLKFEEIKLNHKAFFKHLLEESKYTQNGFVPDSWEEYILQKAINEEVSNLKE